MRPREANPVAYAGAEAAELQRLAFPTIVPLQTASTPQELFEAALAAVSKRKWRIVDDAGRRPAVARAASRPSPARRIMGFRDDVVLRIRADQAAARGSISAPRRATAGTISAPMRSASSA